ncbi:DUF423 domain-containing protein [Adhaeribacter radiodurans]|uniref:DUF423 domain-containing protein n=1 Tax=Adhaeribacter radiodurans TaxID=2745197 RepID=A0A7L7L6T0_9BACT|nr:DUF423 domain-containing protein [Adhaeribacter radiodurans]QMU28507.1 DUF423 domain-containing protein [Adhaeribacter radiodurans]
MNQKQSLVTAAILGAITVMIGAFGAHALRPSLEAAGRLDTFETAVKYQMYHTLAILLIGLLQFHVPLKQLRVINLLFLLGILVFSGSLYVLCLTGITVLGAITPFGGVLFIAGWLYLAMAVAKIPAENR